MARKPRIYFPGAHYHVMLRGNAGANIFFEYNDYMSLLSLIEESVNRYACRIHAFCLMSNHIHLAISVSDIPLSKIIQNISFRYARLINKKYSRIGHVFQGRYKALLIEGENYFLKLVRYIHLNPVKAKIVSDPGEYEWSSHKAYIGVYDYSWLTTNYTLKLFSPSTNQAIYRYVKFINAVHEKSIPLVKTGEKTFPEICDDAFMKRIAILQNSQNIIKNDKKISLQELISGACAFYKISENELYQFTLKRDASKVRAIIAWLALEFKVANLTTVAQKFNRENSTISRKLNAIISNKDLTELYDLKKYILKLANTQA